MLVLGVEVLVGRSKKKIASIAWIESGLHGGHVGVRGGGDNRAKGKRGAPAMGELDAGCMAVMVVLGVEALVERAKRG